ncbi:MAG: ribbon-helix-helix domain-containing protein [Archaeoglobaceae archaeon]|nr:ribbon-helix-helix protein, CopG family [Candidatus Bathyarchaeota archaeon]
MKRNLRITVRLKEADRRKIEELLKAGRFKNISQVVREAIKEFLSKQLGEAKP